MNENCNYCQKQQVQMKKCSNCNQIKYCSKECQKSDWKQHKTICKTSNIINPSIEFNKIFQNAMEYHQRFRTEVISELSPDILLIKTKKVYDVMIDMLSYSRLHQVSYLLSGQASAIATEGIQNYIGAYMNIFQDSDPQSCLSILLESKAILMKYTPYLPPSQIFFLHHEAILFYYMKDYEKAISNSQLCLNVQENYNESSAALISFLSNECGLKSREPIKRRQRLCSLRIIYSCSEILGDIILARETKEKLTELEVP